MGGSPYTPHAPDDRAAMLDAVGVERVEELFDLPDEVRFDGSLGIEARSERAVRAEIRETLARTDDLVEFLGRGHHAHYVPSAVDHLADRSEFLTSYTQYQPEVTQGFLQALFEYQSMLVELTGLSVANCSLYDAASALGEAALLAARVRRGASGDTVLVPEQIQAGRRAVLERYVEGAGLTVASYPMANGAVDLGALRDRVDEDTLLVHAETPTVRGAVEERLAAVGTAAHDHDALFCVGSDVLSLALLAPPAEAGADVVVGEADALGVGAGYGTGHGLFAAREAFLRQIPGRLVGATEDETGRRAYTLTLQTREQHIRKERATSNVCTNQAWLALRTAIHVAALGADGMVELAEDQVRYARETAAKLDELAGVTAPADDRHHLREFPVRVAADATRVREDLLDRGYAVHAIADDLLQVCVTEETADHVDGLVAALAEVVA
ncbi:MAG: aminomethyl-transferring glycine dehydrogenase subunit GcvPA [Haloferacaceae archaeon]